METRDKILEVIKLKGPVLPVQIAKEIGSNILMASAHLAELTASNKLKISSIKVGGSPLYYLQGQEAMLQKYTSNLNDKEKKAFDLLQQNKILRDSEQEPVIRVALREIKDFAVPLNVSYDQNIERFWKWHLISDDEAEQLIKSKLKIVEEPAEKKIDEMQKQEIKPQKTEEKPIKKIQKQIKEKEEPKKYRQTVKDDNFLNSVTNFFENNKINIISKEIIKKNSETDFIIELPSPVGNLRYYCKAKSKKVISDVDLSSVYAKSQMKKLPALLISDGDLSKKAKELLGNEFSGISFKVLKL